MRVIAKKHLITFCQEHPTATQALLSWYDEAKQASWASPQEIKRRYSSASFIGNNRVVFNIKGNAYRLVVDVAYRYQAVYIKFIGTHAAYDKIDVTTIVLKDK